MSRHVRDQLVMHLIVLIWGYTGIIGKWSELSADKLVFLRMLIAAAALFCFAGRGAFEVSAKQALKYGLVGVLIAVHWVTFFEAIDASNVSVALTCMASTSVFAAFLEPLLYRRKIAISEVIMSVVALGGVASLFGLTTGAGTGILLALISSFFAASFTIINGLLLRQEGKPILMSSYEMLGGASVLFLYFSLSSQVAGTEGFALSGISWHDWSLVIILALVCTAIPFGWSIRVMRSLSPFSVCLSINLEPVYAILLALIHFGDSERMNLSFYVAAGCILAAVIGNGLWKTAMKSRDLKVCLS